MPAYDPFEDDRDPFARLFRRFDELGGSSGPSVPSAVPITPEDEQTLLGTLGEKSMSGLQWIGDTLGKGGRAVRGVLAGRPEELLNLVPFSDSMGLTDPATQVTGRDLLTQYGLADANKETGVGGWIDDPMEAVRDIAGFGVDVVTDPLSYLLPGAKAATTAAGQAASKAGLIDDAIRAGKAAGMGTRQSLMKTTARDVLNQIPAGTYGPANFAKASAFDDAARLAGLDPVAALDDPLGGLVGLSKPFGSEAVATLGAAGGKAEKVAKFLDSAGDAVRYSAPGRAVASLFDASSMGRSTREGQELAQDVFRRTGEADEAINLKSVERALDASETGLNSRQASDELRQFGEGVKAGPINDPRDILGATMRDAENIRLRKAEMGTPLHDQLDDVVEYMARRGNVPADFGDAGRQGPFGIKDPSAAGRHELLKGFQGGTKQINDLLQDPGITQILDHASQGLLQKDQAIDAIEQHLAGAWGPKGVRGTYQTLDAAGNAVDHNQFRELAQYVYRHPELNQKGLFTNHWLVDATIAQKADAARLATQEAMYDFFADQAGKLQARGGLKPGEGRGRSFGQMFADLGFEGDKATQQILNRMGVTQSNPTAYKGMADYVRKLELPEEIAKDVYELWPQGFKGPKAMGPLVRAWDGMTSLFKVGVLSWPARHVRDMVSGQARAIEMGAWSPSSFLDAHKLLKGHTVRGAAEIPSVARWLTERGQAVTDENASRALRVMYGGFTKGKGLSAELRGAGSFDEGMDALLDTIPGKTPTSIGQSIKETAGEMTQEPGWYNPLNIAGVGDRTETAFGPARVSNRVGNYTDSMNRAVPWLEELKRGADPSSAMAKVNNAQVDYNPRNFTPTEQALKKIFPFYSFMSRQAKYVASELASKPGGRMAQTIRATNAGRNPDELTPDYVRDTAAIPLGKLEDGSKRYLTGLGLMHEDPFSFMGGGVQGAGLELLSRANPLIKGPLEWITGESFFQKGPGAEGGRALEDLDPTIGRILANVSGRDKAVKTPAALEAIAGNSPASRFLTSLRTATDPRKRDAAGAVNLLTGVRVSDVSPASQDAMIREAAQAALKESGGRSFVRTYIPKDELSKMTPEERKAAQQLQGLLNVLAARAKERKKGKP